MTTWTDEAIDKCRFRMFDLAEIARTMAFRPEHQVLGNKRERMALYGNAVTPPVARLLMSRLLEVLGGGATYKDLFCGAGGTSDGARDAGAEPVMGLNHWTRACETYAANFPEASVDCADVSALTTAQIRRYPDADVLLASPECTNHSLAKGARRRKPQASSLFEDGPAGDDEQDRSRATMWDVVRFVEQKLLKGRPYKALVVENVVDAFRWGANDDGGLFNAWLLAIKALGYEHEIVWLNSMFAPPTPQSRDRMYVVFWRRGVKRPNLRVEPPSWCPSCERVVEGRQTWKRPGPRVWGRYGAQYLYSCPDCSGSVLPGVFPAASAIDFTIPAERIGDRARPLADATRERIRRGLERLSREPFAIRLTHGGVPRPLTLPIVTLTRRHDVAMVMPVAGNTFERTPGNRARRADLRPMDTVHGGVPLAEPVPFALVVPPMGGVEPRDAELSPAPTQTTTTRSALVMANREHGVPRDAEREAAQTACTGHGCGLAVVHLRNHGEVRPIEFPVGTVSAGGQHHGFLVANYDPGWTRHVSLEPFGAVTTIDHHALVVPYHRTSEAQSIDEPSPTLTTRDRVGLLFDEAA